MLGCFHCAPLPLPRQALKKMIPRGLKKEQKEDMEHAEKIMAMLNEGKDIRCGGRGSIRGRTSRAC